MLRHVWRITGRRRRLACRFGHGPDVMRPGAAADAEVSHAEFQGGSGEVAEFMACAGEGVKRGWGGLDSPAGGVTQRLHRGLRRLPATSVPVSRATRAAMDRAWRLNRSRAGSFRVDPNVSRG